MAAPLQIIKNINLLRNSFYMQYRSYHKPKSLPYLGFTRNIIPEEKPPEEDVSLNDIIKCMNSYCYYYNYYLLA